MNRQEIAYWIQKVIIIGLLIFIVFLLLKVVYLVKTHYQAFEEDPLKFGANKYNLDMCTCSNMDKETIYFNKSTVWYKPKEIAPYNPFASFVQNASRDN